MGYSPWDRKASDTTERLRTQHTPVLTLSFGWFGQDIKHKLNFFFHNLSSFLPA